MMSRIGFFTKPLKTVLENTAYTIGAGALGTGIYQASTIFNDRKKERFELLQEQIINYPNTMNDNLHQETQDRQNGMEFKC